MKLLIVLTCLFIAAESDNFYFPFDKAALKMPCGRNSEGTYEFESDCDRVRFLTRIGRSDKTPRSEGIAEGFRKVVCCVPRVVRSSPLTSRLIANTRFGDSYLPKSASKCGTYCLTQDFHVVGGEKAGIKEFPHMAAVGYYNEEKRGPEFRCGGTLISEKFVLTAAHCANQHVETPYLVRLGRTSLDLADATDTGKALDLIVAKIHLPTEYKARQKKHDIALLELETAVTFDTEEVCERINPACFPSAGDETFSADRKFTVIGFGRMFRENSTQSSWLLKAQVTEYPLDLCIDKYKDTATIQSGQICAYDPIANSDTCQGDSGSSMTTAGVGVHYIHGITSYGHGCGSDFPSIYTRVLWYLPWIESIVWP